MARDGHGIFNRKRDEPPPAETQQQPVKRNAFPLCENAESLDHPDCCIITNPGWGYFDKTYCGMCAPDYLKRPSLYIGTTLRTDLVGQSPEQEKDYDDL